MVIDGRFGVKCEVCSWKYVVGTLDVANRTMRNADVCDHVMVGLLSLSYVNWAIVN